MMRRLPSILSGPGAFLWGTTACLVVIVWSMMAAGGTSPGVAVVFSLGLLGLAGLASLLLGRQGKALSALRACEAGLSTVASLGSDWYWETDREYRFAAMSSGVTDTWGRDPEEFLHQAPWSLRFLEPMGAAWGDFRDLTARQLLLRDFRIRHVARDGAVSYGRIDGEATRDPDGSFTGYRGMMRDITREVRLQQRLELQHRVAQIIVASSTPTAALTAILEAICRSMGWQWGARRVLDRQTAKLSCAEYWCDPRLAGSELLAQTRDVVSDARPDGLIWRTAASGEPQWWSGTAHELLTRRFQAVAAAGLHAGVSVPVLVGGRLDSVFELFAMHAERPDRMLIETLRAVGREVGQYLARITAEEARAHLERERVRLVAAMRLQLEHMPIACVVKDREFRIVFWNAAAERIFGFSREEVLGHTPFGLYVPATAHKLVEEIHRGLAAGEAMVHGFNDNVTRDGRHILCEWHNTPLADDDGTFMGFISMAQDVTDRLRAERALRESEEQFHQLAENIPQGFWIADADSGSTLYISPAAAELVGRPLTQLMSDRKTLIRAVHSDDRRRIRAARKRAATGAYDETYRVVRPDGSMRWVHDRAFPVRDAQGRVYRVAGIAEDITKRRQAEDALRASEELLRATFEQAAVGMALRRIEAGGLRWLRVNQRLCEILGYDAEELQQRSFLDITPPEDRPTAIKYHERLVSGEISAYSRERRFLRKDGKIIWGNLSTSPVGDREGRPTHVISVIEDITERKYAEARAHQLNAELEQRVVERTAELVAANHELEAFAYSVSHDLRAPLRALDGFSQILLEEYGGRLDAAAGQYLQRIRVGSQRMAQLIDDLLRLSRVTRQELRREALDLSALAHEIMAEIRSGSAREASIRIHPGMKVDADPRLVRVALDNVLRNAWKFTHRTAQVLIEVGSRSAGGETLYFVRDNGAGFEMRYAEKLFRPFQRLHSDSEFAGTGIGLAIVQRVAQRHGGRVWAEGAPSNGATFYFTFAPPDGGDRAEDADVVTTRTGAARDSGGAPARQLSA